MSASLLAAAAFVVVLGTWVLWFRRIRRVQLPADRTPFVIAAFSGAMLGAASLSLGEGVLAGVVAVLAMLAGLFFCLTVAISLQKADGAIQVGQALPAFQATDEQGEAFDSATLAGQPALIKFFRGHW